jgi:hypothetical protein
MVWLKFGFHNEILFLAAPCTRLARLRRPLHWLRHVMRWRAQTGLNTYRKFWPLSTDASASSRRGGRYLLPSKINDTFYGIPPILQPLQIHFRLGNHQKGRSAHSNGNKASAMTLW